MRNFKFDSFTVAPMRIIGLVLLVIAWSNGTVHGLLAWILLLILIDVKGTFNKN